MERLRYIAEKCGGTALAEILPAAAGAALEAGRLIKNLYGQAVRVDHKGVIDLVTDADRAAEAAILQILAEKTPGVSFLAEESAADFQGMPAGPAWIIDPLDGTTNFAHGFPWFGVSIAYWQEGRCRAGVIYCPMLDELFWAGENRGAWLNHNAIRVSGVALLENSLLATGFPYNVQQEPGPVLAALGRLLPKAQGVRRAGAAALDLAYVACGRLDGFWEINLKPWDTAAGQLLVTEAGGRLTDFRGRAYDPFVAEVVASNSAIHQPLVQLLADFSRG
ncbi:MAG: inositol monophosphatase [Deltaproteobacteria bacterium RIFOXYD12_FULL_57_12]|nr:MAG: inositol monophosphatase [Deltaproteobacteria bacterium RIFOXYD12_FULL_57_12]